MKNFLAILAVLGAVTGPASAQSFCTCDGTGNVLPFAHKAPVPWNEKAALRDSAFGAYAATDGAGAAGGGRRQRLCSGVSWRRKPRIQRNAPQFLTLRKTGWAQPALFPENLCLPGMKRALAES